MYLSGCQAARLPCCQSASLISIVILIFRLTINQQNAIHKMRLQCNWGFKPQHTPWSNALKRLLGMQQFMCTHTHTLTLTDTHMPSKSSTQAKINIRCIAAAAGAWTHLDSSKRKSRSHRLDCGRGKGKSRLSLRGHLATINNYGHSKCKSEREGKREGQSPDDKNN